MSERSCGAGCLAAACLLACLLARHLQGQCSVPAVAPRSPAHPLTAPCHPAHCCRSYRTKANGDAALEPQLAGKLHLYTTGITNTYDPRVTSWKGSLSAAGSAWTHPTAGLVVRLKAAGRTAARVTLCRKAGKETLASCQAGMDNDCNGLVGVKDPRCAVLLRRRKRATAAVSPAAV